MATGPKSPPFGRSSWAAGRTPSNPTGYHAGHTFVEWPDAALCAALEERYKVEVVVAAPRLLPDMAEAFTNLVFAAQQQHVYTMPQVLSGATQQSSGVFIGNGFGGPIR